MFRDLKEYQEIAKIYAEKVSKPENLDEMGPIGPINTGNSTNNVKVNTTNNNNAAKTGKNIFQKIGDILKPKPITGSRSRFNKPTDTSSEIESSEAEFKANEGETFNKNFKDKIRAKEIESSENEFKANEGDTVNQRFKKDVGIVRRSQQTGVQRAQAMAKARIKAKEAGTYKKPKTAQELAKERIKAKEAGTYKKPKTAQELAKERIAAKQRLKMQNIKVENYTPYDLVLEYLLSSEQATTIEEANYVMMQLDEENIQEIVRTIMKTPLVKLIPAAGATIATTKFVASKLGQKSGENQIKNSTTPAPVGDEKKKKGNFLTNFINKKRDESPLGGNYRVDKTRENSGDDTVGKKIKF